MPAVASADPSDTSGSPVRPWPMLQPWAMLAPTPMSRPPATARAIRGLSGMRSCRPATRAAPARTPSASQSWNGSRLPASIAIRVSSAVLIRSGKGRTPARGRHGRVGLGATAAMAERTGSAADRALFCIIDGPTRGRPWSSAGVRVEFRRLAAQAGVRRRFAPHQLRHAHALELAREDVPLNIVQRQLGHANLGTTSIYLQGDRPRGDHLDRPHAPSADDVRQRRTAARSRSARTSGSATALPLHPGEASLHGASQTIEPRPERACALRVLDTLACAL
jgi:Phage integrase family